MCSACGSRQTLIRVFRGGGDELFRYGICTRGDSLCDTTSDEASAARAPVPRAAKPCKTTHFDSAEANEEEEDVEEALVAKPFRSPSAPTAAERAAHASTHLPYRSWCDECVAGRRDNPAHRAIECQENSVHEVMMDYCFLRRDDEAELITVLIFKERQSRAIQAWVVPHRSTILDQGAAVERALEGIRRFGLRETVIIKTDNEPAILALREQIMAKLHISALEEEPQPHE